MTGEFLSYAPPEQVDFGVLSFVLIESERAFTRTAQLLVNLNGQYTWPFFLGSRPCLFEVVGHMDLISSVLVGLSIVLSETSLCWILADSFKKIIHSYPFRLLILVK